MLRLFYSKLVLRLLTLPLFVTVSLAKECTVALERRVDCFPDSEGLTEVECVRRKCCYSPHFANSFKDDVPWCFFPEDYENSYVLANFKETDYGFEGGLKLFNTSVSYPKKALPMLKLDIFLETPERLHFKITDATKQRYEVPIVTPKINKKTQMPLKYKTEVSTISEKFNLLVKRAETNVAIFDTSAGPLLYGDQFLQISTLLSSSNIYGLGERHGSLRPDTYWHRIPFWAGDNPPSLSDTGNLYGDHPFYMVVEPDGKSHGVFFLNSNAKEAELQSEPALTWRSIGGIMDFYIFLGPTPEQVIQQYLDTIGHPFMPPMWSLGYHLCRWGYHTANNTLGYVEKMRAAKIPQDVQWNDIDYMYKKLDFTYDQTRFDTLPQVVENIHAHDQHYVMIIDPGISNKQPSGKYPAYDDAITMDVLVKDMKTKKPVVGIVWPGEVVFPDFTHPKVGDYWYEQLNTYHASVPFDGVWIDMNEISNFQDGSPVGCHLNSTYDYPSYHLRVTGGVLFSRTLCPSSLQYASINYDVHSLTGMMEMKATSEAVIKIRNKRPFVISRSTFPSAGLYGGHWTGDIKSTWEHMRLTIPAILGFNMFGIPLVGADICGFGGQTNEELCTRWSQLGAFYPFSRNHNDIASSGQAPVDFSTNTQAIIRSALSFRYSLLPYLYTLFHFSHVNGSTVARPLFFEFPLDQNTLSIDDQFLWGAALLISPVLYPNTKTVNAYLPNGLWYDLYMSRGKEIASNGQHFTFDAPIEYIPVHLRGGHIIPGCLPGLVTSMKTPLVLLAAIDNSGAANGSLFWDDGDSLNTYPNGDFAFFEFVLKNNAMSVKLVKGSKTFASTVMLDQIYVFGIKCQPSSVTINGNAVQFSIGDNNQLIIKANASLGQNLGISWSCK